MPKYLWTTSYCSLLSILFFRHEYEWKICSAFRCLDFKTTHWPPAESLCYLLPCWDDTTCCACNAHGVDFGGTPKFLRYSTHACGIATPRYIELTIGELRMRDTANWWAGLSIPARRVWHGLVIVVDSMYESIHARPFVVTSCAWLWACLVLTVFPLWMFVVIITY